MAPSGLSVPFQHFSGAKWCKEEKNADDKRRSVSAQSFHRSTRQFSSQHGARSFAFSSPSSCGCLLVAYSLHFHSDGNYREKEAEIKY